MKTVEELLSELAQKKIVLYTEGEALKVNAPKGAMTAELAASIKQHKQELVRFLARAGEKEEVIAVVSRDQDIPVSFAQQRLWFLDQLEEDSATYNVPLINHISGNFNIEAMKAALSAIVRRHEVLRTSFQLKEQGPVQIIHQNYELAIETSDLQELFSTGEDFFQLSEDHPGRKRLMELVVEQAWTPFDLATGPIWRVNLYLLSPTALVLLVNMHHIVADAWSMEVVMNEFQILYKAFSNNEPDPLEPLPIQYADYAVWLRNWLKGERLQQQQEYWRKRLKGHPPLLELPTDHPRPAVQDFSGTMQLVSLPKELSDRLDAFSKQEGVTMFMTLMAAFNVLLARLSGQEDIAVGSPIANRERLEIERLVGYFSNTFVLRTHVPADTGFRNLLAEVSRYTREAYDHQDLPFEHLVDVLATERSLSYSPIFQAMFTLREITHQPNTIDSEMVMRRIHPGATTSKFDITLNLTQSSDGISGFFEYATPLFEAETIERWFNYYTTILEAVLAEPDRGIGSLDIMGETERNRVLFDHNKTETAYPQAACIHQHFEEQATKTPDRVAVIYDAMEGQPGNRVESLTFDGLNRRANQLAHVLTERGIGPDKRVGLCLERSLDMVVGMLAILKAGGAYVPLDPAYPADRLAYMVDDADVTLMLTSPQLAKGFPERVEPLFITDDLLAGKPETNIDSGVTSDNLLYVIYTSGSTGQPKGIALSHEALVNLILWHLDDLSEPGGVLQFASMSFDASYHEIFAAWNAGNPLLLVPEELRYDFTRLPQVLAHHQIRKTILPVVVLQQWAEMFPDGTPLLEGLRDVITTGEQLQVTRPIVQLFGKIKDARLHNHYGPAETHVVTAYSFGSDPREWRYHAPIGHPIANTQIHILDDYFQPTPQGVKGHLYIGGTNLARGYLARPGMTAGKFVPNPFGKPGSRLYQTGDLARYLEGGNIEFLGRADHMIKIRGFRVEPGEVEAVLTADERVNRAIVLVRGETAQDKRLVAYVVPEGKLPNAAEVLRNAVAHQLPEYMVPSAFVVLDEMPLSPTGKVDRKALPAPDFSAMSEEEIVPPRNEVEEKLLTIWAPILELDPGKIGVHHNFFSLGGHSLSATRVMSRVRLDFGIEIPLRDLFISPTIAGLGEEVQNRLWLQAPDDNEINDDMYEEAL